jgi:hypothetical protein
MLNYTLKYEYAVSNLQGILFTQLNRQGIS